MNTTTKTLMEKPTPHFNLVEFPMAGHHAGNDLLKTSWQQKWKQASTNTVSDQYGFTIIHVAGTDKPFTLQWKGTQVAQVHKLATAKMISCILMNDILINKTTHQ